VTHSRLVVLVAAALVALTACGGSSGSTAGGSSGTASPSSSGKLTGTLTVFAASSLTGVFGTLGNQLKAANPGLDIRFSFAGSSALATQITQGAPADVFAAASPTTMATVTDAKLASGSPAVFTQNVLEIAVPKGNPGHVTGLADFAKPALTLAICAPDVPCGTAATKVFAAAKITPKPDSLEEDVKAALTKVSLAEVDAALVYTTDVQAAGGTVHGISFPEAEKAVNKYPICVLSAAPNKAAAQGFVDLVRSAEGQAVLTAAGFRSPGS
jgi:molybdate transport system substrate-binding protein